MIFGAIATSFLVMFVYLCIRYPDVVPDTTEEKDIENAKTKLEWRK